MVSAAVERPLVTVGITAYNAQTTIERAVDSALAQTWRPLEILIVDDASADDTPLILERLSAVHAEIRVITHSRNLGTASARNSLIENARGEAIAFFDDDDVSHPDRIARQWHRLTSYEQQHGGGLPLLCHTGVRVVYPDGSSSEHRALGSAPTGAATHGDRLVARLLWGYRLPRKCRGVTGTCSQLGRLATYRRLGGFDPRFRRSQDSELNVRLARAGGHLIGVADALVTQELVPAPDRTSDIQRASHLLLLHKHRDAFPSLALFVATLRWTEAKYALRSGDRSHLLELVAGAALLHPLYTLRRVVGYILETSHFRTSRQGLAAVFRSAE